LHIWHIVLYVSLVITYFAQRHDLWKSLHALLTRNYRPTSNHSSRAVGPITQLYNDVCDDVCWNYGFWKQLDYVMNGKVMTDLLYLAHQIVNGLN